MSYAKGVYRCMSLTSLGTAAVAMAFFLPINALPQDQAERKFHEVTLSAETCFTFDKLAYAGNFFEFTARQGSMVTGTTAVGVTVVIILSDSEFTISAVKDYEAKFQEAFEAHPVTILAKQAYIRLNPADYEALTKGSKLAPAADEELFKRAKTVYDEKFNGSYHAGPLAIIPPPKTFFADLQSEKHGQVLFEEGDFLRLIRVYPYKSVYPSRYLNPKR